MTKLPDLTPDELADFNSFGQEAEVDADLAMALDNLDITFAPTIEPQPQQQEAPDPVQMVKLRLSEFDNAPSEEDIANWIGRYGTDGVFAVTLAPEDIYVMRYINAAEHRAILRRGTTLRQNIEATDFQRLEALDEQLKFLVAKTCMLWYPGSPRELTTDYFDTARAGLLNNLVTVVNINSYFFNDPQQVLAFTTVLH
jgi:hypothetical protein